MVKARTEAGEGSSRVTLFSSKLSSNGAALVVALGLQTGAGIFETRVLVPLCATTIF